MEKKGDDGLSFNHDRILEYAVNLALELLAIPSVAGDCVEVIQRVAHEFEVLGVPFEETKKGALIASWRGADEVRHRVVSAHVDTLGAVVRQIKPNGRLRLFPLGGFDWRSFAGENCFVRTLEGREYRGTLLPDHAARHAFSETVRNEVHDLDNVELRLDIRTDSRAGTEALGIHCGDLVFFDPRSELTETGYLKSRFLDDKVGVAILLGAIKSMREQGLAPAHTTHFYISNYEEIGHGTPVVPPGTVEVVAVDVGVVAEGCASSEHAVTILSRDNVMPYDREGVLQLKRLADDEGIPYRIDAYINYASDASVTVKSGKDVRAVCFGPGTEATHHYERTHRDAVDASIRLLTAYLQAEIV